VSLHIHRGQFAGIVGPSGAGKTTLLRTILGSVEPVAGEIRIAGKPSNGRWKIEDRRSRIEDSGSKIEDGRSRIEDRGCSAILDPRSSILDPRSLGYARDKPSIEVGYVPQLETVDWNFPVTVEEVVLMGRTMQSGPWPWVSRWDRQRVAELLEQLGIGGLQNRHIRDLSGGQQQRIFLARALIAEPDLLILDEPTAGVDVKTRDDILHLLTELNHQGITVLLTTHDLNTVAAHLPWVICLNQTVIAEGRPDDVFHEEILNRTFRADLMVVRQNGLLFVVDRPHDHAWGDLHPPGSQPHPHPIRERITTIVE
jgi:zinc/manganese transport system ATP-binding protein/zinc transport system ATP-binding protein